jgi:hypothetical protein
MTIGPSPERVQIQFIPAVDHTLDALARNYGTTSQAIYAANRGNTAPGTTAPFRSMHEFLVALDDGYHFALPAPPTERGTWESISMQAEGVLLSAFCSAQNESVSRRGQAQVTPEILWAYALNASARSAALAHAGSPEQAREWDAAPGTARLAAGTTLWLPYTPLMVGPPVAAAPHASHVLMVDPPWLAEYHRHLDRLGHETERLQRSTRQMLRIENQCTYVHMRAECLKTYFELLRDDFRETENVAPWLAGVETAVAELVQQSERYLLANPIESVQPYWLDDHKQIGRRVVELVCDPVFDERLHAIQQSQAGLRGGYDLLRNTYAKLEAAVVALRNSRVESIERVLREIDQPARSAGGQPSAEGISLRTALVFFGSIAGATVANTPGPASLVVAIAQTHVCWKVCRFGAAGASRVAEHWIEELVRLYRPTAAAATEFRTELQAFRQARSEGRVVGALRPAERAARHLTGRVTQGTGWTGLLLLCNLLSFYSIPSAEPFRIEHWFADSVENADTVFGYLSAATGTVVTTAQLVSQLISNLESETPLNLFLGRAGKPWGLGNWAALFTVISSMAQLREARHDPIESSDHLHMCSLWMQCVSSSMVLVASFSEFPLVMAVGVVVGLVGQVVGNWDELNESPVKRYAKLQLALYTDEETNDVTYGPVFVSDEHGGGRRSTAVFRAVIDTGNAASLQTALEAFERALDTIPNREKFISDPMLQRVSIESRLRTKLRLDDSTIEQLTQRVSHLPIPRGGGAREEY